jgi:hypothetical protein
VTRWNDDLGRELREAPVPAHRPDHFERVRERVREAEAAKSAAGKPDTRRAAPPGAPPRRALRFAAFTIAAAAVAAVVATWAGLPGLERSRPQAATAATVLTRVEHALAGLTSISGDVVEYGSARGRPYARHVGSFVFTSQGDCRITQPTLGIDCAYDARSRLARHYAVQDGSVLYGEAARGLPDPGPFFSPWEGVSQVLDRSTAAYARAVIADLDPGVAVTPLFYEGRRAWEISVPAPLADGTVGGSARIVVDIVSGYPLVVEHWGANGEVSGTRLENVRVGGALDRDVFSPHPDADARLIALDERYRTMTLLQAARLCRRATTRRSARSVPPVPAQDDAAFTALMPEWTPAGYRLDGVTGAVNGPVLGRYTEAVGRGRTDSVTVVLTYRRGFDRFSVVSRWRHDNPPGSDDPFDENALADSATTAVALQYGALRGTIGRLVIGMPDWPHLYVTLGDGRRASVSVAGDLTRAELVRIAESMVPLAP